MRQPISEFHSMVLPISTRCLYQIRRPFIASSSCLYSTRVSKPLRILFCGSDEFSCASLRAVHQEKLRNPRSIASIDVLVRPGKLSGRGLKSIREVPIKRVARELGLAIHERDTFTGWTLPQPNKEPINLIIAVSFGLFVPPRILKCAEYGGINVHPSLLPDFRGPAPLHHTLLAGENHTGVTLQTLHPDKFDHGAILAQTLPPGFQIPNASECTYQELLEFITPKAAELLAQGIRDRLFILESNHRSRREHNISSANPSSSFTANTSRPLRYAPKITSEDRHINLRTMAMDEILRRDRVLGRLWSFIQPKGKEKARIVFGGLANMGRINPNFSWPLMSEKLSLAADNIPTDRMKESSSLKDLGNFFLLPLISSDDQQYSIPALKNGDSIVLRIPNNEAFLVKEITVEGRNKTSAAKVLSEWVRSDMIESG